PRHVRGPAPVRGTRHWPLVGPRGNLAEVTVQELDDPGYGALLDLVDQGRAVGAGLGEDVAVQRVVPRHPGRVLAGGLEQVVTHPEDALQVVTVAAHHQYRQVD